MNHRSDRPRRQGLVRSEAVFQARVRADAADADAAWRARDRDPATPHLSLENLTETFRASLERGHLASAREATDIYNIALEVWERELCEERSGDTSPAFDAPTTDIMRAALNRKAWHHGRATGQRERFDRVRACGVRTVHAQCKACRHETRPVPEGCGVRRVCARCDTIGAVARRARFGRARGRALVEGQRYGLHVKLRPGGRFTEKMLTLTVPHLRLSECIRVARDGRDVATHARDDTHARILALWFAWPRFLRKWNRHWKERRQGFVKYHRAFEWTPGSDGIGHPHFHVYVWSPWVDREIVREWWAEALREVGVRVPRTEEGKSRVVIDLRMLRSVDLRAARELLKGGRRQALTLSRVDFQRGEPGLDAFAYADGWTVGDVQDFCSPEVLARLYMALEARRMTQASRDFFTEDPPSECPCCGGPDFRVWIDPRPIDQERTSPTERGPP